ncbi:MAG: site-2 protease family protein [Kofleriaceae bacterium]
MRRAWIHLGLFVAACATTYLSQGIAFSATLMGILLCHELGHYVVARRRQVDVSLPYFIPLPPGITLGTLGAVIRMNRPIEDRNALFDVGAAGPIAGLIVAVPLLVIGLTLSEIQPLATSQVLEGNSLLYIAIKYLVFGQYLPGDGFDVSVHPMAFAAWVGLLVTAINLMPIGQLDGGHIAKAALGERHERWSSRLNVVLPLVGLLIGGAMFAVALDAGRDVGGALRFGVHGLTPWLVWAALLYAMRRQAGEYHPPVGHAPLTPTRRVLAIGMLVIFILVLTPVPFRPVL